MKKYKKIKKLDATEFRRLTGVKSETFLEMVGILKQAEALRMSKGGKPHRLIIEDRLLMALEYLREYRTYFRRKVTISVKVLVTGAVDMDRGYAYQECPIFFARQKALLKSDVEFKVVLIDAAESSIERPKKKSSS
jgi:hypothetical protein